MRGGEMIYNDKITKHLLYSRREHERGRWGKFFTGRKRDDVINDERARVGWLVSAATTTTTILLLMRRPPRRVVPIACPRYTNKIKSRSREPRPPWARWKIIITYASTGI